MASCARWWYQRERARWRRLQPSQCPAWPGGEGLRRSAASRRLISGTVSGIIPGSAGGGWPGLTVCPSRRQGDCLGVELQRGRDRFVEIEEVIPGCCTRPDDRPGLPCTPTPPSPSMRRWQLRDRSRRGIDAAQVLVEYLRILQTQVFRRGCSRAPFAVLATLRRVWNALELRFLCWRRVARCRARACG